MAETPTDIEELRDPEAASVRRARMRLRDLDAALKEADKFSAPGYSAQVFMAASAQVKAASKALKDDAPTLIQDLLAYTDRPSISTRLRPPKSSRATWYDAKGLAPFHPPST